MSNETAIIILDEVLQFLEKHEKSNDISRLMMRLSERLPSPSVLSDFFIETSLTADPAEEDGAGCYSVQHLKKALLDFKENGTTNLLNKLI